MHEDEGGFPGKLQAMIDVIGAGLPSRDDRYVDLGRLKADAANAAAVLIKFYGDAAFERAKLLERRSPQSYFARMVTAELCDHRGVSQEG